MSDSTLVASKPSTKPAAEPKASKRKACPKAIWTTCLRCAPRAILIPSSRRRLLTEYAAIPKMPVIKRKQVVRSEEHTSELQSRFDLVCRLLLEKKKKK